MTERTVWRLQFATGSRDTLVTGNERCEPVRGGRWLHTVTLPGTEGFYRGLAAKAEHAGAEDIRLGKRTVVTTYGEWEEAGGP